MTVRTRAVAAVTLALALALGGFWLAVGPGPPPGALVYVSNEVAGTVSVIDSATDRVVRTIETGRPSKCGSIRWPTASKYRARSPLV